MFQALLWPTVCLTLVVLAGLVALAVLRVRMLPRRSSTARYIDFSAEPITAAKRRRLSGETSILRTPTQKEFL